MDESYEWCIAKFHWFILFHCLRIFQYLSVVTFVHFSIFLSDGILQVGMLKIQKQIMKWMEEINIKGEYETVSLPDDIGFTVHCANVLRNQISKHINLDFWLYILEWIIIYIFDAYLFYFLYLNSFSECITHQNTLSLQSVFCNYLWSFTSVAKKELALFPI